MFQIALCQMKVTTDKQQNLFRAGFMIREAAGKGAQIVALPEMFNCPYTHKYFKDFAEVETGETVQFLSGLAAELGIYLVGGTIPELAGEKVYNTSFSFDRKGNMIGKHRKIHLYDVDIKGLRFLESDTFAPGGSMTILDTEYGKIGVAVCYDIRFPELFRKMTLEGAKLVFLPAAFNMTTGPAHWDLLMRSRAMDNQFYLAAIAPSRDAESPFQAYGNSCVTNPWGDFCGKTDARESIVYANIDPDYIEEIRNQLPLLKHRRPDLY